MEIPKELIQSLRQVTGFDEDAFNAVHASGEQVTSIRINPAKTNPDAIKTAFSEVGVELSAVPWCEHGFYLSKRPSFILDPLIHAGAYYVQEASSMFLWHVLQSLASKEHNQVVLDLCAAPGGKSTLLHSFFSGSLVVSNEVIKSRASILQENLTKWGSEHAVITNNDSKDFSRLESFFDVIVADVPCSGSGLFRKDPEAIREWSTDNVNLCSQRQQRIIADIIPALKQNGLLIYSTCSYSTAEDEAILDWIVESFGLTPVQIPLAAEWNIIESVSPLHRAKGYRFFPDKLKGEGFFIAAFRQQNETSERKFREANITLATAKERTAVEAVVNIPATSLVFKHADLFHLFPAAHLPALRVLMQHLYLKQAGIAIGSIKGNSFVPAHALALASIENHFCQAEIDRSTAVSYLRKQDIQPVAPQGWCRLNYQGLGLGWIKNLPNRTNNYYPSEWRILKS